MNMNDEDLSVDEIREILAGPVDFKRGRMLRRRLGELAANYRPRRTPSDYMNWMDKNNVHINEIGPQQRNLPYKLCMFTGASQHVYGDSMAQCLDQAMDVAGAPESRSTFRLPQNEEEVNEILDKNDVAIVAPEEEYMPWYMTWKHGFMACGYEQETQVRLWASIFVLLWQAGVAVPDADCLACYWVTRRSAVDDV